MRAAIMQGRAISIETVPDPTHGPGQLLVAPIFTGICGSDLHYRERAIKAEDALAGAPRDVLPAIVPGHEFSAEFIECGPDTESLFRPGQRVVPLPFTPSHHAPNGFEVIGLSPTYSGGLSSLSVVDAQRAFAIPDNVPSDLATLTEPMAVTRGEPRHTEQRAQCGDRLRPRGSSGDFRPAPARPRAHPSCRLFTPAPRSSGSFRGRHRPRSC